MANCEQTMCVKNDISLSSSPGSSTGNAVYVGDRSYTSCKLCSKGYSPAGFPAFNNFPYSYSTGSANYLSIGSLTCQKETNAYTIQNCDYAYFSSNTAYCYACKTNYAVKNAGTGCYNFTADRNCRTLLSGNVNCSTCFDSYYWNLTECKLNSNINNLGLTMLLSIILMIFFN